MSELARLETGSESPRPRNDSDVLGRRVRANDRWLVDQTLFRPGGRLVAYR